MKFSERIQGLHIAFPKAAKKRRLDMARGMESACLDALLSKSFQTWKVERRTEQLAVHYSLSFQLKVVMRRSRNNAMIVSKELELCFTMFTLNLASSSNLPLHRLHTPVPACIIFRSFLEHLSLIDKHLRWRVPADWVSAVLRCNISTFKVGWVI